MLPDNHSDLNKDALPPRQYPALASLPTPPVSQQPPDTQLGAAVDTELAPIVQADAPLAGPDVAPSVEAPKTNGVDHDMQDANEPSTALDTSSGTLAQSTIDGPFASASMSAPPEASVTGSHASTVEIPDSQPASSAPQVENPSGAPQPSLLKAEEVAAVFTTNASNETATQPSIKIARERDDDGEDVPGAKRTKTESETNTQLPSQSSAVDGDTRATTVKDSTSTTMPPPAVQTPSAAVPASLASVLSSAKSEGTWGPMTDMHYKSLTEGLKNIKKNKSAVFFAKPVDPVALNIPNYPNVIKHPMDISTIEQKLRDRAYASVDDYVSDFFLMTNNAITFNGPTHAVGAAALNLAAHVKGQLKKIPKPGESTPAPLSKKPPKQKTPAPVPFPKDNKRRDSRPAAAPLPSPAAVPTYAVASDGVPQIRRDSTAADGRPKREIHKPPPRDLPYANAKPRKKKYAIELKFCEYVITEMKRPRYAHIASPFLLPVDPVALAIPDYFKVIKKPMDLQTAERKLKVGEYENAKEFEQDVRLIFANCYKFNPGENPVNLMGKEYEKVFNGLWADKSEWVAEHAPGSGPQSPEYDSDSEEEEEEEEEAEDQGAKLALIQQQIFALSEQAQSLLGAIKTAQPAKSKKKSGKLAQGAAANSKKSRKTGTTPANGKKTKPPKTTVSVSRKPVTNAQKKEISERIGELPPHQIARCANLIKDSLRRIGEHEMAVSLRRRDPVLCMTQKLTLLQDKAQDEMEFDIDIIPDDALHEMLKIIRKHLPPLSHADGDPAPAPVARQPSMGKPKKNKPMTKHEQEARINRLKGQLEQFQNAGDGQSPDDQNGEGSSEDSDSGSESEAD